MGLYIDPTDTTKEAWLEKNGTTIAPSFIDPSTGEVTVCLVDNGPFRAAAVAFNEREFQTFARPSDTRPKVWFRVPTKQIDIVTKGLAGKYFSIID